LPHRRSRRQSNTISNATGVPTPSGPHDRSLRLNPPPSSHLRVLRGLFFSVFSVSSVLLARRFFSAREDFLCRHESELRVRPQPLRLFGCGSAALWFAFSVPSMSCPMWGRLSSLRPAFEPAWVPFTHCPLFPPNRAAPQWSKPPGLPCRRSRRQSNTIPSCAGVPTPSAATAGGVARTPPRSTSTRPLFSTSVSSVPSVVWFSPCPLWFVFPVPSPPPVTTFPKSFFLCFSTTCQLPLSPPLAPILYVEGERCG